MSFPAYPKYKPSGFDWLPEVPEHWTDRKIARDIPFVVGWTPPSGKDEYYGGDLPWVTIADMTQMSVDDTKSKISHIAIQDKGAKIVPAGSMLFSFKLSVGKIAFLTVDSYTNEAIAAFLPCEPLDFTYWKYAAPEFIPRYGRENIYGATLLNQELICSVRFSAPARVEQIQIARFLDHETARIDALIEEQQRMIELLKEKRQAVISHAVTKGLDPTVPMNDSGIEWLGEVPVHWAIKRLKQLVLDATGIQMGPFGGMLIDLDDSDTGYKVYGQENTISGDFSSGNRWIPEDRYFALSNYHLEVGDIVLTRKGSLGNCRRVSILPQMGIIDSDTIRVRVQDQTMYPDYLELLLHEAGYISTQLSLVKRGAILSGLNTEIIANLVIAVPPRNGQEKLLLEIKASSSKFDKGISDCEYAVGLLKERRSALISAAVTGKIDVRGWQPPGSEPFHEIAQEAV